MQGVRGGTLDEVADLSDCHHFRNVAYIRALITLIGTEHFDPAFVWGVPNKIQLTFKIELGSEKHRTTEPNLC